MKTRLGWRWALAASVILACASGLPSCAKKRGGGTVAPPPGSGSLELQVVVPGLNFPVFLTAAPGDASRLFVIEKVGRIRIIKNGTLLPRAFLDMTGQVALDQEQGLLGMAFQPDYATSGRFFVFYTDPSFALHVARFHVSTVNPDSAVGTPDVDVITIPHPGETNHNGGMIAFGPDGMLYVAVGDGGGADDPNGNGQDRTDLLGSLLRLDVSGSGGYTVPVDNPFGAPDRPEIWSYGLRNPWRFSFDRANGDLYIGDVGQGDVEEVDVATTAGGRGRGLNFGWNTMEGDRCFNPSSGCVTTGLTMPEVTYDHGEGCSITGGYVYRGSAIPWLVGTYFYADYCVGFVRSFRYVSGSPTEASSWPSLSVVNPTSFGQDADGELYLCARGGTIYKIVETP
jgi:glucose/arabinose dehydrogenase